MRNDEASNSPRSASRRPSEGFEPDAPLIGDWLHIEADDTLLVYTGKVEVSQHIRASLAQAVAEELRVDPASIQFVLADTDRMPYDMGTVGSRSTPITGWRLHQIAASARAALRPRRCAVPGATRRASRRQRPGDAPDHWPRVRLRQTDRRVAPHPGDRRGRPCYATRALGGRGCLAARPQGAAIVTGAQRYTPDLALPGMLAGAVLRPPSFGATLVSLDAAEAEALPQVRVVRDGTFVFENAALRCPEAVSVTVVVAARHTQSHAAAHSVAREKLLCVTCFLARCALGQALLQLLDSLAHHR